MLWRFHSWQLTTKITKYIVIVKHASSIHVVNIWSARSSLSQFPQRFQPSFQLRKSTSWNAAFINRSTVKIMSRNACLQLVRIIRNHIILLYISFSDVHSNDLFAAKVNHLFNCSRKRVESGLHRPTIQVIAYIVRCGSSGDLSV